MGNGTDRREGTPEDWLLDELADAADEEVELEMEDAVLSRRIAEVYRRAHADSLPRPPTSPSFSAFRRSLSSSRTGWCTIARRW